MTMTPARFAACVVAAALLEVGIFYVRYRDLLYLRHPTDEIVAGPPDLFLEQAASALERDRLTVKHLEVIAESARRMGRTQLEQRALQRRVQDSPDDHAARLQLGDALRRSGALQRAEEVYVGLLSARAGTP